MTSYEFGDVVLVPFPFTDQSASKRRPAVVVSSPAYHSDHINVILMPVSSQISASLRVGEVSVTDWKKAGLIGPSIVKAVMTTVERRLVIRKLGTLSDADRVAVEKALRLILDQ
jgi:mRNA-degrading endonuclease toxin of MazEF toxin-antitoxin module